VTRRAVFLDRDGVLNASVVRDGKPFPPDKVGELVVLPDARAATDALKAAGYVLLVVTNQPDVGRGTQTREAVDAIHARMRQELPALDAIYSCFHGQDEDGCDCRKPRPGMIVNGAREWDVDPKASFLVGDRWRDIEAGVAAGCRTVFLDRQYKERQPSAFDAKVTSLADAAAWILNAGVTT
jgi:D-glycero-D-manno-heptose 1,7-bisphosphate phosphatase